MKNLRILRRKKNISMKVLGEKLGLAESTISLYENGKREPDQQTLIKLADYFDVSIDYLIGRSDVNESFSLRSDWQQIFSERVIEIVSSIDSLDLEAAYLTADYFYDIVSLRDKITFDEACNIADELGVSFDYLLGRTDEPTIQNDVPLDKETTHLVNLYHSANEQAQKTAVLVLEQGQQKPSLKIAPREPAYIEREAVAFEGEVKRSKATPEQSAEATRLIREIEKRQKD